MSALDRKESRGGHFREDFPDKDPEAQKYNTVISKAADGSMKLRREPIPAMPERFETSHRGDEELTLSRDEQASHFQNLAHG